jgi:arabinose-5-phosphate isomerase
VVDNDGIVVGIFTDGDLRRIISDAIDIHTRQIGPFISRQCKTGTPDMLAAEALELMQRFKINALLILDAQQKLVGALNMHDLLKAGMV